MTEVVAEEVILLGGRGGEGGGDMGGSAGVVSMPRTAQRQQPAAVDDAHDQVITDDDVPF